MILESGVEVEYRKVCLCAGGSPKLISEHPNVIGIRDTASVLLLQVQYCTVQYSTVQYSTVQYRTVLYCYRFKDFTSSGSMTKDSWMKIMMKGLDQILLNLENLANLFLKTEKILKHGN